MTSCSLPASLLSSVVLVLSCASSLAQDPATPPPPIPAEQADQLMALEGETRTVSGFVAKTRTNVTGIHFLEFRDSSFVCVVFPRFLDHFAGGTPSELYQDKHLEVTGPIEVYRGQPQIKLERSDQVRIVEAPPPPPAPPPAPEPAKPDEPAPVAKSDPQSATPPPTPQLEVVDGKPALDWRLFFPE